MSLATPHDKVRNLGLGQMYEKHWGRRFRDRFDQQSPDWAATPIAQKIVGYCPGLPADIAAAVDAPGEPCSMTGGQRVARPRSTLRRISSAARFRVTIWPSPGR